jgi:hypothetical protein
MAIFWSGYERSGCASQPPSLKYTIRPTCGSGQTGKDEK